MEHFNPLLKEPSSSHKFITIGEILRLHLLTSVLTVHFSALSRTTALGKALSVC